MTNNLLLEMMKYYAGDAKRIQHFTKVYSYAKLLGVEENLDEATQFTLETAAIVHDIGIKTAEARCGSANGKLQEQYGPEEARAMLTRLGYDIAVIERVCYLVGHHHTYNNMDGVDYQLLVEADFLVNLYEDNLPAQNVRHAYEMIFRTESGKALCKTMYADCFEE